MRITLNQCPHSFDARQENFFYLFQYLIKPRTHFFFGSSFCKIKNQSDEEREIFHILLNESSWIKVKYFKWAKETRTGSLTRRAECVPSTETSSSWQFGLDRLFLGLMIKDQVNSRSSKQMQKLIQEQFKTLDKNNDGSLDVDELRNWLKQDNPDVSNEDFAYFHKYLVSPGSSKFACPSSSF